MRCRSAKRVGVFTLWISLIGAPLAGQDGATLRLSAPDVVLGGFTEDVDEELSELGGVTLLPDGKIVVGDRFARQLKVFGPQGRFIRDVGQGGQGPGEYEYIYEMDWCSPGELSVYDAGGRIHRYTAELELVSTDRVSIDAIGGGVGYERDCHPNGFSIVTGWGDLRTQFREGYYAATGPVVLLRGDELVHHFGERLSSERIGSVRGDGSPSGSGPHPLGRATVVALGAERVYIGGGESYEIEVYDLSGQALPPLRWTGPDLSYDDELVDRLAEAAVADAPSDARPRLRRWYADLPELDQLPAYDRILVSDTNEVWVRQFVRPESAHETWVVFDPDHELIGYLELPPRATLWEVRGDRVVYSVLDEWDVPEVRVSRLKR